MYDQVPRRRVDVVEFDQRLDRENGNVLVHREDHSRHHRAAEVGLDDDGIALFGNEAKRRQRSGSGQGSGLNFAWCNPRNNGERGP